MAQYRRGKYDKTKAPAPDPVSRASDVLVTADGVQRTVGEANRLAWRTGLIADLLLRKHQFPLYEAILSTPPLKIRPIVCSRRWGKTMTVLICIEEIARKHPGSIIRLAFPTIKQSQTVVLPNWRKVLRTCPEDLRPQDRTNADEGGWTWPSHVGPCKCGDPLCVTSPGPSMLFFAGTDDNDQRERLRGSEANWFFGDEAGSQKELKYTVGDILSPQLDEVNGRGVLITTPPKSMDHEFVSFWDSGEQSGMLVIKTIFQNSHNTPEKLRDICSKANPRSLDETKEAYEARIDAILAARDNVEAAIAAGCTPTWAREYLCGRVTDASARVCPEFREEAHVVESAARPAFVDRYVVFDQGNYPDFFAILWCEFDFSTGKLRVLREWLERHKNTREIVAAAKQREMELWCPKGSSDWSEIPTSGPRAPRRFADDPRGKQQLDDMRDEPHNYTISLAEKSPGPAEQSRAVRYHLTRGAIEVDSSCRRLIQQMRDGVFKEKEGKQDFERSKTLGHLDAFSALALAVRCVNWEHNAIPAGVAQSNTNVMPVVQTKPLSKTATTAKLFFRGALVP